MDVALGEQQLDLVFREIDVDQCQRCAMEREIPLREPRVLPFVRASR
jgi:hypothetical protein